MSKFTLLQLHYSRSAQRFLCHCSVPRPSKRLGPSRLSNSHRTVHSHAHSPIAKETPLFGDDPPLYDGKPRWWSRWAWGLLALDMLFTASTIDITMNHWSQLVEQIKPEQPEQSASSAQTPKDSEYELRPFYQRLLLSAAQLVGGAVVGGFILASRERTVWRIQLKRLPILVSSKSKPAPSASPVKSKALPHVHSHSHTHIPAQPAPAVLTLSTASGRSKRFHVRDCLLSAGRDPTEVILRVNNLRGHWWIGLNGATVLGMDEAETTKRLSKPSDELVKDEEMRRKQGLAALAEMRERMMKAWSAAGGMVDPGPKRQPGTAGKEVGGWTGGPVTR